MNKLGETMSTITAQQEQAIAAKLAHMTIPAGIGDERNACSIAAINLAISGQLTDLIPKCMSEVIGRWIIAVQDAMPNDMRNSKKWKSLLPLAAGTGREHEAERAKIILDWMWGTVLPTLQPLANKYGFGEEWAAMCVRRTQEAAARAAWAAREAACAAEARAAAWRQMDPCALLERLIKVGA